MNSGNPFQIGSINNVGLKIYSMILIKKENLWVGSGDGHINIFNIKSGQLLQQFEPAKARIYSMVAANDEQEIWCASDDGSITIINTDTCKVMHTITKTNDETSIKCLLNIDENTIWSLASTLNDSTVTGWNVKDRTVISKLTIEEPASCMALIKDTYNLVWVGGLTKIFVVYIKTLNKVGYFNAHSSKISSLILTNQNQFWSAAEKTITIWDPKMVDAIQVLNEHDSKITSLCCCGDLVFSGSLKSIIIWNAKELKPEAKIQDHGDIVSAINYVGDNVVATGSLDRKIYLWTTSPLLGVQSVGEDSLESCITENQSRRMSVDQTPVQPVSEDQLSKMLNDKLSGARLSSSGRNTIGYKKHL